MDTDENNSGDGAYWHDASDSVSRERIVALRGALDQWRHHRLQGEMREFIFRTDKKKIGNKNM